MKALFITAANALGEEGRTRGGVQLCTIEYLTVLRAAGFGISTMTFTPDRRLLTRIKRRLRPMPHEGLLPPEFAGKIIHEARSTGAQVIFLNMVDIASLAKELRQALGPQVKIVLLSHGLQFTDLLHDIRIKSSTPGHGPATSRELLWMANHLTAECDQRKYIDHVFCLSEFEVGLEQWIGAQSVSWLPRIVEPQPIDWRPTGGRLGFVGTLDHPPNAEGLHLFLQAMERVKGSMRVRVVGGPAKVGKELAATYSIVDYLGQLDDAQVLREAETWTSAVHPLFCYAHGCSTKLATYLSWQIPVITTPQGRRGYLWREGNVPQEGNPDGLAKLALTMNDPEAAKTVRADLIKAALTSPTLDDVVKAVSATLAPVCSQAQ